MLRQPSSSSPLLPPVLAELFEPELSSLVAEVVAEIQSTIPAYEGGAYAQYRLAIRTGTEQAIRLFVARIADPTVSGLRAYEVHYQLGQYERQEGRSLDDLQAAYRVGARVGWRRVTRIGYHNRLPSLLMSQLADTMLAFVDELAVAAQDGYRSAIAVETGPSSTPRTRLAGLILARPAMSEVDIAEAAELAGWIIPDRLTPIVLRQTQSALSASLPDDVLVNSTGNRIRLLVPGDVDEALIGTFSKEATAGRVAVGSTGPLAQAAESARLAGLLLDLAERGRLTRHTVLRVDDHIASLLLNADPELAERARQWIWESMRQLTTRKQLNLLRTLRSWLDNRGSVPAMAEELGLHRQTVRYRIRLLEEAFGDHLRDPADRLILELVLRGDEL